MDTADLKRRPVETQTSTELRLLESRLAELDRKLQERTLQLEHAREELKGAHEELSSFSYSVSHDLRSPLAAVQGYIQFFLEDHGAGIAAAGIDLLREASEGALRMGRLIEDLQTYSRFSRQPLEQFVIPLKPLVMQVLAALRAKEPERRIDAEVDDLGECACDPPLMEEVFTQLLSNAVKFTRGKDPARILVRRLEQEGETVFQVSDNGVGFDMQYAHKLFGVFQRLHSAAQFEGRGIGLSIVHRIVQRHGGRIWAHAAPDQGATFFFSLPNIPL